MDRDVTSKSLLMILEMIKGLSVAPFLAEDLDIELALFDGTEYFSPCADAL